MSKITMYWADWRGNERTREVNQVIDVSKFLGTPGYSALVVAANTHLSVTDLERFLDFQAKETPGVGRSASWIQRRRWLYQQPGTNNAKGRESNEDGKYARAVAVMRENPKLSVRNLTSLLRERRIIRSREWVRKHRCDPD